LTNGFTTESVSTALTRYLDAEITADELRAYLAACDSAIEAGEADRALSGPVGAAVLVLMELDEGVRPPADVRSTLESAVRALTGAPAPRPRPRRNPIPRPKGAKAASSTERAKGIRRQTRAEAAGQPPSRPAKRGKSRGR
jgi:hypothetical protein